MTKTTTLAGLMLLVALPIFAQLNISHQSTTTYGPRLNDIWGYAADGNEYALVGLRTGVNILDITDPANPVDLGTATGPTSTWRDIKTYGEYGDQYNMGIVLHSFSRLYGTTQDEGLLSAVAETLGATPDEVRQLFEKLSDGE